ncbi:hypothetical protein [Aquibacillus kalidii]|uniref:hypothetical protein n=1 Tax=Aquibacillus kalidii TaxID=2762597 RepID=UPI0016473CF5|nr:hypothetical protein [Aquibacillus kalidii]
MRKIIIFGLVFIALFSIVTTFFLYKADYHGRIGEITENNFSLFPLKINPEAEYVTPKIYFDNNTNVVGIKDKVDDLKDGQEVKVWVVVSKGEKISSKIKVLSG